MRERSTTAAPKPAAPMHPSRLLHCALLGLLLLGGCRESPTPPVQPACELPVLPTDFAAPALSPGQLRGAVEDAATRMSLGLGSSAEATALSASLGELAAQLSGGNRPAACEALVASQQRLDALPNTPGSRPDRSAIQLVLHLASAALRTTP